MIIFSLIVSTFIVHILIVLRTVNNYQLRATGVSFLFMGVLLFPYLPFKFIYDFIKWSLCAKWFDNQCFTYTDYFSFGIIATTVMFIILSLIPTICMMRWVKQNEDISKAENTHETFELNLDHVYLPTSTTRQEETENIYQVVSGAPRKSLHKYDYYDRS